METRTACPDTPAVEVPQVQPVGLFSAVTKPGVFSLLLTQALPVFSRLGFCGGQGGSLRFLSCVNRGTNAMDKDNRSGQPLWWPKVQKTQANSSDKGRVPQGT